MSDSLNTHGALTEDSGSGSLTTPIGKGREGKGRGGEGEVGHLAYPSSDATAPQCEESNPCPIRQRLEATERELRGARLVLAAIREVREAQR